MIIEENRPEPNEGKVTYTYDHLDRLLYRNVYQGDVPHLRQASSGGNYGYFGSGTGKLAGQRKPKKLLYQDYYTYNNNGLRSVRRVYQPIVEILPATTQGIGNGATVSGLSNTQYNGFYALSGTQNSKPKYVKGDFEIYWGGADWVIYDTTNDNFTSSSNVNVPFPWQATGWTDDGINPAGLVITQETQNYILKANIICKSPVIASGFIWIETNDANDGKIKLMYKSMYTTNKFVFGNNPFDLEDGVLGIRFLGSNAVGPITHSITISGPTMHIKAWAQVETGTLFSKTIQIG